MKLDWAPKTLLAGRHARVTLAHEAGAPGSGSSYAADLDVLDADAWSLVAMEVRDPAWDKAPEGFEVLDATLTKLLEAVEGARTNLRTFGAPTDAADAFGLWEDEVARDVDFTDEMRALEQVTRELNRSLEAAAEAAEEHQDAA